MVVEEWPGSGSSVDDTNSRNLRCRGPEMIKIQLWSNPTVKERNLSLGICQEVEHYEWALWAIELLANGYGDLSFKPPKTLQFGTVPWLGRTASQHASNVRSEEVYICSTRTWWDNVLSNLSGANSWWRLFGFIAEVPNRVNDGDSTSSFI